jgi:hypothetical protein
MSLQLAGREADAFAEISTLDDARLSPGALAVLCDAACATAELRPVPAAARPGLEAVIPRLEKLGAAFAERKDGLTAAHALRGAARVTFFARGDRARAAELYARAGELLPSGSPHRELLEREARALESQSPSPPPNDGK